MSGRYDARIVRVVELPVWVKRDKLIFDGFYEFFLFILVDKDVVWSYADLYILYTVSPYAFSKEISGLGADLSCISGLTNQNAFCGCFEVVFGVDDNR